MRPHGKAQISARNPRALGVCDRCGFLWNNDRLQWQWDWKFGPRLQNLRIQVCPECLDIPQESGRTIVLPPDPLPIPFPNPEDYAAADNPLSGLGYQVTNAFGLPLVPQSLGGSIGNMTLNGGIDAAFNGGTNKRAPMSAALSISNSSFQNTVGKNWNAVPSGISTILASTIATVSHTVSSVVLYAPSDQSFLNTATGITGVHLNGSTNGTAWTTIVSTTTRGGRGETLTITSTIGTAYPYHQIAIQGDGISAVAIAQAQFNVSDAAPNDI